MTEQTPTPSSAPICGDPEHRHAGVPCEFYANEPRKMSALDLLGIAPDFTGPGTTDQFIAHQRDRCEPDCPYEHAIGAPDA